MHDAFLQSVSTIFTMEKVLLMLQIMAVKTLNYEGEWGGNEV
jgi:hypothetical protein